MIHTKTVLLLCLQLAFLVRLAGQNYDPSFFPIGVWSVKGDFRPVNEYLFVDSSGVLVMPSQAPSYHSQLFKGLSENGFNAAFMSLDPIGPTLHSIMDTAQAYGIKIIASAQNLHGVLENSIDDPPSGQAIHDAIINDSIVYLRQHPATLGYYLYDEPLPGWIDFHKMGQAYDSLLVLSGGNHPILSAWNDVLYMSEIDGYLGANNDNGNGEGLDVLMADIYPFSDSTSPGSLVDYMPAYFSSYGDPNDPSSIGPATPTYSEYLEQIRQEQSNPKNDRPMWIIIQAFGDAVQYNADDPDASWAFWRQVYPKELRLQIWMSLMHGAKGIWYFLYETEYPVLLGLLDASGQSTVRLQEAAAINSEVNAISPILLKLDVVEGANISASSGEVKLHDDVTSDSDDKYVIVVNKDYYNDQNITVTVDKADIGYQVNSITDEVSGANITFTETAATISFDAPLAAAKGGLYHLSAQMPMPVQYVVPFSATRVAEGIRLHWETSVEINAERFVVQRLETDGHWQDLTHVPAGQKKYGILDKHPLRGINTYRLAQVDFDQHISYSRIVAVVWDDETTSWFYPNPTTGDIRFADGATHHVLVTDMLGRQILHARNASQIHIPHRGIYLITLLDDHNQRLASQKIIVTQ